MILSDAAHVPDPVAYGNVKRVKGKKKILSYNNKISNILQYF